MGLFSKKKKAQENIRLLGFPGHVDTCKCLYLAAEKGVQIDTDLLDLTGGEQEAADYLGLSPFGKIPCLTDGDVVVSGAAAILPYLDIKGGGQSLTPKKAVRLGEQNYWIEVGQQRLLPNINTLLDEQVLKPMTDAGYTADQAKVDAAISAIDQILGFADDYLEGKKYFAGDYSFAEIHWVVYLHFCAITGHGSVLDNRPHLKQWFEQIKARKNGTRSAYAALPSLEQIKGKNLRSAA